MTLDLRCKNLIRSQCQRKTNDTSRRAGLCHLLLPGVCITTSEIWNENPPSVEAKTRPAYPTLSVVDTEMNILPWQDEAWLIKHLPEIGIYWLERVLSNLPKSSTPHLNITLILALHLWGYKLFVQEMQGICPPEVTPSLPPSFPLSMVVQCVIHGTHGETSASPGRLDSTMSSDFLFDNRHHKRLWESLLCRLSKSREECFHCAVCEYLGSPLLLGSSQLSWFMSQRESLSPWQCCFCYDVTWLSPSHRLTTTTEHSLNSQWTSSC